MSWKTTCLNEFIAAKKIDIQTGPFGTQLKASDYVNFGIPVINVRNIGYGKLKADKLEYISENTSLKLHKHTIQADDIIFGRKGAVDRHLLVQQAQEGWIQGSDCIRLRVLHKIINPRFLSYSLMGESHKKWILTQCSNKSTMASLNQDVISRIIVTLPDECTQERIVSILSAYDDLIENNCRRIQLLEESARQLYKEWFVRMRFPGHEHVKVVDGVPEGWERKTYSEVSRISGGGTPNTQISEYWNGDITWVVPTDVTRNNSLYLIKSERKITEKGLRESSAKIVPPYTILMTSRASVGFFAMMDHSVCTNQGFINIIPNNEKYKMYLLYNLISRVEEIRKKAKGTTYPEISKGQFASFEVIIPQEYIVIKFDGVALNIFSQVRSLQIQNEKLTQARDLLLPKLMSGEVAV